MQGKRRQRKVRISKGISETQRIGSGTKAGTKAGTRRCCVEGWSFGIHPVSIVESGKKKWMCVKCNLEIITISSFLPSPLSSLLLLPHCCLRETQSHLSRQGLSRDVWNPIDHDDPGIRCAADSCSSSASTASTSTPSRTSSRLCNCLASGLSRGSCQRLLLCYPLSWLGLSRVGIGNCDFQWSGTAKKI